MAKESERKPNPKLEDQPIENDSTSRNDIDIDIDDSTELRNSDGSGHSVPVSSQRTNEVKTSLPDNFEVVEITRYIPKFYRLGYVLESIAENMRSVLGENNRDFNFYYSEVPGGEIKLPIPNEINDQKQLLPVKEVSDDNENIEEILDTEFLQSASYIDLTIKTTFDIPINIVDVERIMNNSSNSSVLILIERIIGAASNTISSVGEETSALMVDTVVTAKNPNVIEVIMTSKIDETLENEIINDFNNDLENLDSRAIFINYAKNTSLVESLDVSSKIDANAWAAFRQSGFVNRVGFDLTEYLVDSNGNLKYDYLPDYFKQLRTVPTDSNYRIDKSSEEWKKIEEDKKLQLVFNQTGQKLSDILQPYVRFVKDQINITDDTRKELNRYLGNLIYLDPLFYNKLLISFIEKENNVFMGRVLSNYLLTVVATIHGTVGISPLDPIVVDNVIEGIRGIYYVSDMEESLSPGEFNTLLTLKLAKNIGPK